MSNERQKLVKNNVVTAVAKIAHNRDREALGGIESRATSLVQQVRDGHQSSLVSGLGCLNGAGLHQILEIINVC